MTRVVHVGVLAWMLGCVPSVIPRVSAGDPGVLRLRNESDETVCYVELGSDGARPRDRLDFDEVVLPGEERDFALPLAPNTVTRARVLDCAERELFVGDVVVDTERGVRVTLWLGEDERVE